ncbi:MAG: glycosyltransferase family 4 protein [Deltaproteobacteria bacterium]|nr:glycosyltransferase family 4 protein [Deltaproteobacteria bacterium]
MASQNERFKVSVCDLVTSFGGVQRVMVNLLPELARQFEIQVVDPYANPEYRRSLERLGIGCRFGEQVFRKPYIGGRCPSGRAVKLLRALPRILKIRSMLARAICEIQPHCVYMNQLPVLRLMGSVHADRRIPMIYHAHGFSRPSDIGSLTVRFINARVGRVIAVSRSTARILMEAGIKKELIEVCYNSVPVEEIERYSKIPPEKPLPQRPGSGTVFLLPASIQETKGQHLAIKAMAELEKEGMEASLWLAGDVPAGGSKEYFEMLHRLVQDSDLNGHVQFLGWREDMYGVMAAADVVMLCSKSESFGMALAEAMVLGKPCIGARIGGMPEVIENEKTGLLFDPGSLESLRSAMAWLSENRELRERYGRAGMQKVREMFAVEVQAERVSAIVRDVARPAEKRMYRNCILHS